MDAAEVVGAGTTDGDERDGWPTAHGPARLARPVVAGLGLGAAWYWPWRFTVLGDTGVAGVAFLVLEIVAALGIALTAAVVWRSHHRPTRVVGPVSGTVDVFITVCGEPPELVDRTIEAALALTDVDRVVVLNDGWLAGAETWRDIELLAAHHGVECLTRRDGERGKAGNLNGGLARSSADFVLTLDADHVVRPDAIVGTLGYFVDEDVAFVASYQHFDVPHSDPLNNKEPFFYEVVQPARDRDGVAFSCGNGTVWRRAALDTVGGFSEWNLVEDLHTSYRLHSRGWQSAYCPEPLTVGTAPTSGVEYLAQRRRWAIDSLRLLFHDSPLRAPALRPWDRVHYVQTCTSYLFAALNTVFLFGPAAYLLLRVPLLDPGSDTTYLAHTVPYLGSVALLTVGTVGLRRGIRSFQTPFFASPTYLAAVPRALFGWHRPGGITPKTALRRVGTALAAPAVLLAMCVAAIGWSVVDDRPGASVVAIGWSTVFALALVGPVLALGGRLGGTVVRWIGRGLVSLPLLLFVVGPGSGAEPTEPTWVSTGDVDTGETHVGPPVTVAPAASEPVVPTNLAAPSDGGLYFGVSHPGVLAGPEALLAWEDQTGARPQISHWFQQWYNGETRYRGDWIDAVHAQGAVPMVSWEPWAKPPGSFQDVEQERARLTEILSGDHDDYVRGWAEAAAADGRPLLLRFMHEMNGWWYPWSVGYNDNSPEQFVAAWRHVHDLFTAAGATNVSWIWSVNEFRGLDELGLEIHRYYPGDEYVDWVSYTGFNWGDTQEWSTWSAPGEIFADVHRAVAAFGKPIMIAEVGTTTSGGDAAAWISELADEFGAGLDGVDAVVWFDMPYDDTISFRVPALARPALQEVAALQTPLAFED